MEKHDTLLVSSPVQEHRQELREIFGEAFHLLESSSISQMLLLLRQNMDCIAALLLDITQLDPIDIAELQREENRTYLSRISIIALSENDNPNVLNRAFQFGASDVIPLDYDPNAMRKRVENIVDLHLHKQNLESLVEEQKALIRHSSDVMVDALSSIIEYRSVESGQHILRIRHFTKILLDEVTRCCPEYQLNEQTISIICSASALHDIGKIAIPDAILMKPGSLTPEEREIMKTHASTGFHILESLTDIADKEYLRYAHNICHYHHERWDGKGYPEGLKGDAIPICAQVVGLADVFDALTSSRVYKNAYSVSQAVNMILRGECGVFSPKLLECFKNAVVKLAELAQNYADGASPKSETFDPSLPVPASAQAEDTVERISGKYYALVHLINGFLIELDVDRQIFHLIYNPYPELASLLETNTLNDIQQTILQKMIHPADKDRMIAFINEEIPRFLKEGLRHAQYRFRFQNSLSQDVWFDLALMRSNPLDANRRTLAILARKVAELDVPKKQDDGFIMPAENRLRCRNDQQFTLLDIGDPTALLAGYSLQEIRENFGGHLLNLVYIEDQEMVRQEFTEQLKHSTDVKLEYRLVHKDGSIHWFYNISRIRLDESGQEVIYSFLLDINGMHRDSDILQQKLQRYEIILAQTENVLFDWEVGSSTINFSDTWETIFGYPPVQWKLKQNLLDGSIFHPDDVPTFIDRINALEKGSNYEMVEVRIATSKGRYLWCRFRATALRNARGELQKICGIIINIDAEKQAEQLLQDRADQDSLTKLLNKDAARKQAEEYFARYPEGVNSAVLIIDLDNFKHINDQYGHLFGDTVLTQVAREIKKLFRGQDIVARIGGDEFMVVMRGISDAALLRQRSQQLLQTFRNILQNFRHKLPLSCSIGIALSPLHGKSYIELFRNADLALYRAKARGKNCFEIYNPDDAQYLSHPGRTTAVSTPIDSDTDVGIANDSIVRYALQKLNSSQDVASAINDILCLMGEKMNVSRVYVFENSEDNRFCYNTYEWCNQGIHPEIDNLQSISYESDIPGYEQNFNEHGIFYCPDVTILPKQIYDILAPQGIKSMLQCAIRENGVFRGYIGFDECREQRLWTKEQIRLLSFLSETISVFLLQLRRQKKSQKQADTLRSILENQDAWIYIVEPDTFRLLYTNAKLSRICAVQPGIPCYQTLRGLTQPCSDCPVVCATSSIQSCPWLDRPVLTDVSRIRWEGKDAFLITTKALSDTVISEFSKKNSQKVKSEMESEIPV